MNGCIHTQMSREQRCFIIKSTGRMSVSTRLPDRLLRIRIKRLFCYCVRQIELSFQLLVELLFRSSMKECRFRNKVQPFMLHFCESTFDDWSWLFEIFIDFFKSIWRPSSPNFFSFFLYWPTKRLQWWWIHWIISKNVEVRNSLSNTRFSPVYLWVKTSSIKNAPYNNNAIVFFYEKQFFLLFCFWNSQQHWIKKTNGIYDVRFCSVHTMRICIFSLLLFFLH